MKRTLPVMYLGVAVFATTGCEIGALEIGDILDDAVIIHNGNEECPDPYRCDEDTEWNVDTEWDTEYDVDDDAVTPDPGGWVDAQANDYGIQGWWWTAVDLPEGEGSEIDIDIMPGYGVCAHGTGAAVQNEEWGVYWGAMLGLSLCENDLDETPPGEMYTVSECPRDLSLLYGFTMTIDNMAGTELRVMFGEADRDQPAYISTGGMSGSQTFEFWDASVGYDPEAPPIDVEQIDRLMFQVPTTPDTPTPLDFCITELKPLFLIEL